MNASWETTAMLMGDHWIQTIIRVVTPNAFSTIIEVFSYYFINAMVTVSAVIFIAGARTMVITTKIKELQYCNKFNEVFVLSLLMLATNLVVKAVFGLLANRKKVNNRQKEKKNMNKKGIKRAACAGLAGVLGLSAVLFSGCGNGTKSADKQVVIYSNADDEAVDAMKQALDDNGYKGRYIFQTFGTSELGGKLLAEGKNVEADLITMSTFYVESAQEQNQMFQDLTFATDTLEEYPSYCTPITVQEGTIIVNTELMKENNLDMPTSLKDLAKPEYEGQIAVTDIASSSTAWLLIQGLVSGYGEDGTKDVLKGIYKNAGDHIEESGSGPLKLVRAGEVAIGFGLRQQAVADKASGLPINYVDPSEGNFTLTESAAVVDKGDKSNPKAMEMAECIIKNGRAKLLGILDQFAEVKPYVLGTMEELRKRGIAIGSTTGYTDKMMAIVVPKAKENGYVPDAWFSPDAVGHVGRPFPYMIFQNMQPLHIQFVSSVTKVGDTISDIKEGKNAGVYTVGVVEGSSEMGLTQAEYEALPDEEKEAKVKAVMQKFVDAGADEVIRNMGELVGLL